MSESYDLRSNLKNKPGAQGTLFQVKDKGLLNPQQRWPQGYTPERLNEVRGALKDTPIVPVGAHQGSMYANPARAEGAAARYRDRTTRAVARSTAPAKDLQGIKEIHGETAEGTSGTYWHGTKKIAVDMTLPGADKSLLHEIGHHVDNQTGATAYLHAPVAALEHARQFMPSHAAPDAPLTATAISTAQSRVRVGVGEAVADNYYEEHHRSPGRKGKAPDKGLYEENGLANKYTGYTNVRPQTPMSPQQFDHALFPQSAASGQTSELQRRLAARTDANRHAIGVPWEGNK